MTPKKLNHTLLFVYGTLKRGYANHALLSSGHFIGKAKTHEKYGFYLGPDTYDTKAPHIPYLFTNLKPGDCPVQVQGEVWEVGTPTLVQLDRLEGHPEWYRRIKAPIRLFSKEMVSAYTYFLSENPEARLRPIESGCF